MALYINEETREVLQEDEVRLRYPNVSLAVDFTEFGPWHVIVDGEQPEHNENQVVLEDQIDLVDGVWTQLYKVETKPDWEILREQKELREREVERIQVEVDGMLFDGNELAQERMSRVVLWSTSDTDKISWVLANNQVAEVTISQLKQALRLAGLEQARLWITPYTEVNHVE